MTAADLEAGKKFGRYLDVDGDGIPYRTYPGTHPTKGAFFTRGTSKDRMARYSEEGADYQENMERLLKKHHTARTLVPAAGRADGDAADAGWARSISARPARRWTRPTRCWPSKASRSTCCGCAASRSATRWTRSSPTHDKVFVVEQNRDGQLRIAADERTGDRSGEAG